jgi:hypothetical protein
VDPHFSITWNFPQPERGKIALQTPLEILGARLLNLKEVREKERQCPFSLEKEIFYGACSDLWKQAVLAEQPGLRD